MFRLFGLLIVVLLSSYSLSSRAGLDEVRAECTKIGFKVESDKHSDCVLALTEQMSLDMLSTNESFKKAFPIGRLDNIAINGATCNGLSFTNPVYKGASIKLDGHNRFGPKSISITKVNNKINLALTSSHTISTRYHVDEGEQKLSIYVEDEDWTGLCKFSFDLNLVRTASSTNSQSIPPH